MKNLNALHSPYDNVRPKAFFSARRYKLIEDMKAKNSGKSYNPLWNKNGSTKPILSTEYDSNYNEFKLILPWILLLTLVLINILSKAF